MHSTSSNVDIWHAANTSPHCTWNARLQTRFKSIIALQNNSPSAQLCQLPLFHCESSHSHCTSMEKNVNFHRYQKFLFFLAPKKWWSFFLWRPKNFWAPEKKTFNLKNIIILFGEKNWNEKLRNQIRLIIVIAKCWRITFSKSTKLRHNRELYLISCIMSNQSG